MEQALQFLKLLYLLKLLHLVGLLHLLLLLLVVLVLHRNFLLGSLQFLSQIMDHYVLADKVVFHARVFVLRAGPLPQDTQK